MKLWDHTCACKGLTNFECKAQATGNGIWIWRILHGKIREITLGELIFVADFSTCGTAVWQPILRTIFDKERNEHEHLLIEPVIFGGGRWAGEAAGKATGATSNATVAKDGSWRKTIIIVFVVTEERRRPGFLLFLLFLAFYRFLGLFHKKVEGVSVIAENKILKNREIVASYLCLQQFDKFWM